MMEDIDAAAALVKAFPEDTEKVADNIEELKIIPEKVTQDIKNEILIDIDEDVLQEDENGSEAVTLVQGVTERCCFES